ncbi:MAG: TylF/MycF family methyltransferase [Myxococcota bacterium]
MGRPNHLYLDLMKKILANVIYQDTPLGYEHVDIPWFKAPKGYDAEKRKVGLDWPSVAHTMVGLARLNNVHECVEKVIEDNIPGDLIETGVWRGGVCILMRAVLAAHGITDRRVWVADSFEGIPTVDDDAHPLDVRLGLHRANKVLAVSVDQVKEHFRRYDLLDDQVQFIKGFFCDSLPNAPVERLAVLRLDGDLYESTIDSLSNLYPKLSVGGFVIVDDYALRSCRKAIDDFREQHGIEDEVMPIDDYSVYWRRSK